MTLRAILTKAAPVAGRHRYGVGVGVAGEAPNGKHVYRPRFLRNGPWCKSAARKHANRLPNDLDRDLIGHLLGW